MEKFDFATSEDLGINSDDKAFLSRFENNLAMECRPRLKQKIWTRKILIETFLSAAIFALVMWVAEPFVSPWFASFNAVSDEGLTYFGLSLGTISILTAGALGLLAVVWPQIIDEIL